jgi:hypothetical protein
VKYKEYVPHASLQDDVSCFWVMEREYTPEHPEEDVTPDAFVELILNFGDPYVLQAEGVPDREMPRAILVGLQQKPLQFRCRGTVRLVATRFHAWGAFSFLAGRARGVNHLGTTLGREWDDLATKVEPAVLAEDYDAAVAVVEDHFIEKRLTAGVDLKTIKAAARMLHLQKGQFRVAELAERCNLSSRQAAAAVSGCGWRFTEDVGSRDPLRGNPQAVDVRPGPEPDRAGPRVRVCRPVSFHPRLQGVCRPHARRVRPSDAGHTERLP